MKILSIDCGIKNLAFCTIQCECEPSTTKNIRFHILNWQVLNVGNDGERTDFYKTSENLIDLLAEHFIDDEPFDYILIENQPVQKNPIMKSIQIVIYTFFLTIARQRGDDNTTCIKLMSASNKLKVKHKPIDIPTEIQNITNAYRKNKMLSIHYAKHYLTHVSPDPEKLQQLLKEKKKDDLADSFLQAVFFIERFVLKDK
jgi:hypothetical protein